MRGLGITNLELFGRSLRLRWLWQEWTAVNKPWQGSSLPCDETDKQLFRASTTITLGNGNKSKFWHDRWLNGSPLKELYPSLYQLATRKNRSVAQEIQGNHWLKQMRRMNTTTQVREFILLWHQIQQVELQEGIDDAIAWRWTPNGSYSANSAYRIQFVGGIQDNRSDFFWKAKIENKCKFFGWLMIHRKILTADKLQLRGWDNSHICPLCGVEPEIAMHLLMECAFAKQVWRHIWQKAGLHMHVASTFDGDMLRWWSTCRREMAKEQRRNFDGLFIYTAWGIWLQRNARIFNGTYSTVMQVVDSIIAMCKAYVGAHVLDE